ncbi:MAG: triple tyrosine motif-containing protein [Clostridium sp.]|uniref:triple tyrosine motif-containing protein n=1 Tax=Clostridium sp. TaxID=1506 RepID=UPI00290349F2|nr:triple tyrosine motif-containing protein [Clostridium sp.]MDU1076535.1 triple tyrosine motif-containing protein [Clostridium sp.]MDU1126412.1 triple tyrosine motif-containing protein [Clostridium sp.]
MENLVILFDKDSPRNKEDEVLIEAVFGKEPLQYKFIIGNDGVWNTIQEFSESDTCIWNPSAEGKYIVMVQGKKEGSSRPFDYLAKEEFVIGEKEIEKLIKDVNMDKTHLTVGEKITIDVLGNEQGLLYRFWIKGNQDWELIRDYTTSNRLVFTANKEGKQEILIECKEVNSSENFDEFTTIKFDVVLPTKIEITDFKCLTEELLINQELVFKVSSSLDDKRSLLYKFIKISKDGKVTCIQDYSSRRLVSYQEKEAGEYKLLCLVRDILSNKEYDDRAIMLYSVKAYNPINIKSFTPDTNSPQMNGSTINFKAEVDGGREIVYRYIVEGEVAEDSGYIRRNEYTWETQKEGEYTVTLYVKDISYDGDYEDKKVINYTIDKKSDKPVKIVDIITDNKKTALIGQTINMKVKAEGGISLKYSFVIYKDNKEKERIGFSDSNWINFIPDEKGEYEVEIRVKDKYSNKEYDSHTFIYVRAKEYLPGEIDYILLPNKSSYLVGDLIDIEAVVQNTRSVLIRYVTKINGYLVEDTGFIQNKKIQLKPKCSGKYTFEVYSKNIKCEEEFDSKKEVSIYVSEATPVTNTKILCDREEIVCNEEVTFKVTSVGGKDVCYEFYIMEKGNWIKTQSYSKKDYYTFIPFLRGEYRVMVLAKSFYKKVNYEDYGEFSFTAS